jgi:hypothetical protein
VRGDGEGLIRVRKSKQDDENYARSRMPVQHKFCCARSDEVGALRKSAGQGRASGAEGKQLASDFEVGTRM